MCDTWKHTSDDDALVALDAAELANPAVFDAVRQHPYADECCRVELGGDMKVRYCAGWSPWYGPRFVGARPTPSWAPQPAPRFRIEWRRG